MASTAASAAIEPSFNDMIIASDIIDTIRSEERAIDFELSFNERRKTFIERMKEEKRKAGVEVSDDVVEAAVDRFLEQRLVFKPMPSGVGRVMASLYVRRNRYLRNTAIALVTAGLGVAACKIGYEQLYVKPRIQAQLRAEARKAQAEQQLETRLKVQLPSELKAVYERAVALSAQLADAQAKAEIDQHKTEVDGAIAARDVDSAERGLRAINNVSKRLDQGVSRIRLVGEASQFVAAAAAEQSHFVTVGNRLDTNAKSVLDGKLAAVRGAASSGDPEAYADAKEVYEEASTYILNDLDIRIVNRDGVRIGVERDHTKHYLVVEAVIAGTSEVATAEVSNEENGAISRVPYWAVRVPDKVYNKVGRDYEDNGIVDNDDAGFKLKGSLAIEWHMQTVNGRSITDW